MSGNSDRDKNGGNPSKIDIKRDLDDDGSPSPLDTSTNKAAPELLKPANPSLFKESASKNSDPLQFRNSFNVANVGAGAGASGITGSPNLQQCDQQRIPSNYTGHLQVKDTYLTGRTLLYFTSVFVSLGVFLFGYDQGVMSGIITGPYFKTFFNNPSAAAIGTMVSILEIGALVSSLLVSSIGEKFGRRFTIKYGSAIFIVGGLIQTFSWDMGCLIFGRIISGIGVGLLSTIVPIYQSEISPPHNRGKLACIEFTGNIVGYATSVWVDYGCSYIESNTSWRLPLFIQCVMGLLLFLGSFVIVETPRWLLNHDHDVEGLVVIADLHSDGDVQDSKAHEEYRLIKETVLISRLEGEKKSLRFAFKRYRTRMLIAMSSQMFAQLNGINVISYYAPLVFEQAGWVGREALLMTGINSIIYIMSTILPWRLVDKWGRKPILLSGALVMGTSLLAISLSLWANIAATPRLVVVFVIIFNAFFGYSWGPIPWLYPVEIAPSSARSAMASASTATNWLFNWLVGIMTPILQEKIHWRMYLIHTVSCYLSFWCVLKVYPETAGLRLEDMDSVFDDRSSTFSFQSGASAELEQQAHLVGGGGEGAPTSRSRKSVHSNIQSVFGKDEIQPPTLAQVLQWKDEKTQMKPLKKFIRRGSETVCLIYSKVRNLGGSDGVNHIEYGSVSNNQPPTEQ
ncbi:unnamed protein product [Kluyveromyces dobzhanskii CBS 2104]|uniref:WGS project CCBQ000000000 data, contig 00106 n=1 Tax=Kluyveromyces dobzhanskii CBS 2104 TaxID=1427455 RepID=A0A0A8L840_9SACH|nr:unnamed protein product [Kluyveromyces dobzhanskii CBS 2104]